MTNNPERRLGKYLLAVFLLLGLFLLMVGGFYLVLHGGDFGISGERVEVIYVQGVMLTGSVPSGFGVATSEDIIKSLREAEEDPGVKAIVMRINSPGGSPAAAQEITEEMEKIDKPIVVSMGDVAASAAYYISAPADRIVANPDTLTGSIGVIWVFSNRSKFYEDEGTEFYIAKSGSFKDMGADWRSLTEEEKRYADTIIVEAHRRFMETVANGRNLTLGEVKDIADGRIITGQRALELGLIDQLGNLEDAIKLAARLGGIQGKPTVTYANKPSLSRLLFGDNSREYTSYYYESPYGRLESTASLNIP